MPCFRCVCHTYVFSLLYQGLQCLTPLFTMTNLRTHCLHICSVSSDGSLFRPPLCGGGARSFLLVCVNFRSFHPRPLEIPPLIPVKIGYFHFGLDQKQRLPSFDA